MIGSFTAGSYTENRRDLDAWMKSKLINPWPLLHDLLWRLATDDMRDQWLEWWGQIRPAFAVTEVDWHSSLLPPSPTEMRSNY